MTMWIKRRRTLTTNHAHVAVFVERLFSNDSIQKLKPERKMSMDWGKLINIGISWTLTNMIDQACNRKATMMLSRNDSHRMILHLMCMWDQMCWSFNRQKTPFWKNKVIWKAFNNKWLVCCTHTSRYETPSRKYGRGYKILRDKKNRFIASMYDLYDVGYPSNRFK
jgi:hypothetical protein